MDRPALEEQIAAADEKIAQRRYEIDALRSILAMREADGHNTSAGRAELQRREASIELYIAHRRLLARGLAKPS